MNRIRSIENFSQALGGALAGTLTFVLNKSPLGARLGTELFLTLAFVVSGVLIWALGVLPYAFLNIRWMRRVLLGPHTHEGTWVDISLNHNTKTIVSYAIIDIFWEDGKFKLEAESFDSIDRSLGTFSSDELHYDGRRIRFAYDLRILRRRLHQGERRADGYCEITFRRTQQSERRTYEGWFLLSIRDQVLALSGCAIQLSGVRGPGRPNEVDELMQPFVKLKYNMVPWLIGMSPGVSPTKNTPSPLSPPSSLGSTSPLPPPSPVP